MNLELRRPSTLLRVLQPTAALVRVLAARDGYRERSSVSVVIVPVSVQVILLFFRSASRPYNTVDSLGSEMYSRRTPSREGQGHIGIGDLRPSGDADLQRG